MDEGSIALELEKGISGFEKIFSSRPVSFAAPGWRYNERASKATDAKGFLYTSNTRGSSPYIPTFGSWESKTLEIPTTLPTLDELRLPATDSAIDGTLGVYRKRLNAAGLNVYTMHAEIEGRLCLDFL